MASQLWATKAARCGGDVVSRHIDTFVQMRGRDRQARRETDQQIESEVTCFSCTWHGWRALAGRPFRIKTV